MLNLDEELGLGQYESPPSAKRSGTDIHKLVPGHNLMRFMVGHGERFTHFVPVIVISEDTGQSVERIFPIKCTCQPDCPFCKLGHIETALAKDAHQDRSGTFSFKSVFNPVKSYNWVVMDYTWMLNGDDPVPPDKATLKIFDTKTTIHQLVDGKRRVEIKDNVLKYPIFYNYIWDVIQSDLAQPARIVTAGGSFYRKYKYDIELFGDGPIPLTDKEKTDIKEFLEVNNLQKIKDMYQRWCTPISREDQLRSFGENVYLNLDSPKVIHGEDLKATITTIGLKAATQADVRALTSGTSASAVIVDDMEVVDDNVFNSNSGNV